MRTITIRNTTIGEGMPKICVPIVGITTEDIMNEAKTITTLKADLVEWRGDWYEDVFQPEKVKETLSKLREILGELPILFTFRTAREGGEKEIDEQTYINLNQTAVRSGNADLIDVEAFWDETITKKIIDMAHANNKLVVLSNHDFHKTPPKEEILRRLRNMQDLGGDISKIAVMPKTRQDVLTLLAATEEMTSKYADRPVITMSMAGTGVISRISGELFGSAITFGAAQKTSAPGQLQVTDLHNILTTLHNNI